MEISIGKRRQAIIEALVKDGRFESASDVINEGIRLVEEREKKLTALRETVEASIARGGSHTAEEAMAYVRANLDKRRQGKAAA